MRISDWSSDVCSSDLIADEDRPVVKTAVDLVVQGQLDVADAVAVHILGQLRIGIDLRNDERDSIVPEIGRATSELQSLMRISYAVFCLKKKNNQHTI